MSTIEVFSIVGSLIVLTMVTQLIRRRRLREEYAILWFISSLFLIVLSLRRDFLEQTAALLGIAYPPSLLLLGGLILGFLLSMHFSIALTRLSEQNKILAQELALLRLDMKRNRDTLPESAGPAVLEGQS
jgi:hypothetical protein